MAERARERQAASETLAAWIIKQQEIGLPLQLLYRDPTLEVWSLRYEKNAKDVRGEILSPWSAPADRLGR